jgi:galactose oxidase-like protein/Kelch motif protein
VGVIRRPVVVFAMAAVLVSCAAEPPVPSPTLSPSEASSPPASSIALDHPPACLDAKLLWADALHRLIMANCVDQFDLASLETVWSWDGERWERLSDDGPPATVVTGIGWNPDRGVLVRYGGIPLPEQDCITETWEWDMTEWREIEADPPEPCDHIELAWDAAGGQMLLVGGGRGPDLLAGTWAWDGSEWSHLTDDGPAPRAHHAMVGSTDEGRVLIYGGLDNSQVFDDQWSWDGSAWEDQGDQPGGSGPGSRSHHGLAAGPDGLVLFGGATGTSTFDSLLGDTWIESESIGWVVVANEGPVPSPRGMPAFGYDVARDLFVLYGGFDADGNPLSDTWEWDFQSGWRCIDGC